MGYQGDLPYTSPERLQDRQSNHPDLPIRMLNDAAERYEQRLNRGQRIVDSL